MRSVEEQLLGGERCVSTPPEGCGRSMGEGVGIEPIFRVAWGLKVEVTFDF